MLAVEFIMETHRAKRIVSSWTPQQSAMNSQKSSNEVQTAPLVRAIIDQNAIMLKLLK